ncbi:MAG TPA: hypothetical protein DGF36_04665 [Alteromonas sp.]|nr:hypothetical protein [Alteromonas sp.]HCA76591.1 hypothetical protein [Alteromonas sp.]HCB08151.1 hypothetical protein [Alteromonas sp.]HCV17397.1 hypothetical protein [Alteromonas sp.]
MCGKDKILTLYNLLGALNTLFIMVSVLGVYSQLGTIWRRKQMVSKTERPTALLSLNQFTVSFFAYLSFFIYGYSIEPFNHYIVWPRLLAAMLVMGILFEIWQDRKSRAARVSVVLAGACLILAGAGLVLGKTIADQSRYIATLLIVLVSVFIAQGYYHQIRLILKAGQTGAVDLKMSQFILLMDISTIAFALSMGVKEGWPLLTLAITSAITKLIIMYLFRWVNVSNVAARRRQQYTSA